MLMRLLLTRYLKNCRNAAPHRKYQHSAKTIITSEMEYLSTAQMEWRRAQEMYKNYPNVRYSSFLECNVIAPANFTGLDARYPIYPPLNEIIDFSAKNVKPHTDFAKKTVGNWMEDYEHYVGVVDENGIIKTNRGIPDPRIPPSKVPCNGCGAHLHCKQDSLPGYIPSEIFRGRTNVELKTIICKRCHFLKNYNIALDVEIAEESYIEIISRIKNEYALAILIVDLLDFPCSIWPGIVDVLDPRRPVFVVGNKVDLLPRDCKSYMNNIEKCLKDEIIKHGGLESLNIKYVGLISARTGFGIEKLITQLQKIWKYNGDVYLVGCTNVGKSSLFNILLNSDYCRPEATNLVRKATTCPWPGTTLEMLKFPILRPSEIRIFHRFRRLFSERAVRSAEEDLRKDQARIYNSIESAVPAAQVGRTFVGRMETADTFSISQGTKPVTTLNERAKEYRQAKWTYDTPGVMHPEQITNLLTSEELVRLQPTQMIQPRAYRLEPNMTLYLAGLGRIDFLSFENGKNMDWVKVFVFASSHLPVLITDTAHALDIYECYLGTPLLGVPLSNSDNKERLVHWPGLKCHHQDFIIKGDISEPMIRKETRLNADIVLSSAGWVGFLLPKDSCGTFRAWTPFARGIYLRNKPLIPLAKRLVGKRKKNSLSHYTAPPFSYQK